MTHIGSRSHPVEWPTAWTGAVLEGVEAALGYFQTNMAVQHQDHRQLPRSAELIACRRRRLDFGNGCGRIAAGVAWR